MHRTRVRVAEDALDANTTIAQANRADFDRESVAVVNLMSAPGAGKTSLLEAVFREGLGDVRPGVLEGDVQGSLDADRLARYHVPVTQLNTDGGFGGECHLDANMVRTALPEVGLDEIDLLIIENVGNLVCPAEFRVGEDAKAMVCSVTEGEDKPLKYPLMFRTCELVVVNKIDLLPAHRLRPRRAPAQHRVGEPRREGDPDERPHGRGRGRLPRVARGRGGARQGGRVTEAVASRIDELSARRTEAGAQYFEAEAEGLASTCHRMAERFAAGGRLLALGGSPQARSDARHVAVEFVHPVIVGKRALPAIALCDDVEAQFSLLAEPGDIVIGFDASLEPREGASAASPLSFDPPVEDPFVHQELSETAYHLLWELVHVFFEHRGLLEGREVKQVHDTGASSFLYPFLGESETDLDSVLADVRASVLMKAREIGELRAQTLDEGRSDLAAAAAAIRSGRPPAGARQRRLGHRRDGRRRRHAPPAARLARAPGAGPHRGLGDPHRDRQRHRHRRDLRPPGDRPRPRGRRAAGDVHQRQLRERDRGAGGGAAAVDDHDRDGGLRRRPGGRGPAGRSCGDHPLRAHPADPGGTGQRVARTARADRALRQRARVEGTVQGVGFRPYVYRLARELGLAGHVFNDERGVEAEVEGPAAAVEEFMARLPVEAPPLAVVESVDFSALEPTGAEGFEIVHSARRGEPLALVSPDVATCDACLAELFDPADRRYRYPFLNCTDCGPRFTIVRGVPYDRPLTTMAGFEMCAACRAEYDDPNDRRFHAQPNACPDCGPSLSPSLPESLCSACRRAGRGGQGAGRVSPGLPGLVGGGVCGAARAQAPGGQAVRADGRRRSTPPASWSS